MPKPTPKNKPVNLKPAGTTKPKVGNMEQQGLDILQKLAKVGGRTALKKLPFGIGSAVGLTQSTINGEQKNASDVLGLVPNLYAQAGSLVLLGAEKEKENLSEFNRKKMQGKDLTKLKSKKETAVTAKETTSVVKPSLIKKIRAYAGVALPDEGNQPNLIGKIPVEEQELAFGTNSQGIMKTRMNPRKKYANGTKSMDPNNYIVSPAETLNDYNIMLGAVEAKAMSNPWLPIAGAIGGAAMSFVGKGINATPKENDGDADTPEPAANGNNNVQADVEVEGGEMYETPQGEVGEFEGPSHEQGGIPLEVGQDVQEGTKVYSDRLKVGNQTLAERKEARERKTANLEKIASQALVDQAVKNAAKRKMMAIQKEEMADLDFQEKVNNMQAMADTMVAAFGTGMAGLQDNPVGDSMEYGYGSGSEGVMKYGNGGIMFGKGYDLNKFQPYLDKYSNSLGGMKPNIDWGDINNIKAFQRSLGNAEDGVLGKNDYAKASATKFVKPSLTEEIPSFINNFQDGVETPSPLSLEKPVEDNTYRIAQNNLITEAQPEETSNLDLSKVSTETAKKQSKAGKFISENMPGVGDLTKLFGNYLGMTAGIKTAGEQRASDVTHTNVYKNAGDESQRLLDNAKQGIEVSKAQAIVKATSTSRGGKRGGRNSARGVNQMRGMDWLYDTALQQQIADISAGAAQQISGIDVQKSGVAMNADQLKGQGEYQAAMANEAAKDAYYTALGLGRKDFATGLQQTGKDLNDMKTNKILEKLLSGDGEYAGLTASGEFFGKPSKRKIKSSSSTTTGEDIITLEGIQYKRDKKGDLIKVTA